MGTIYLKNIVNIISANAQNSDNPLKVSCCRHVYGYMNSGLAFIPRLHEYPETIYSLYTDFHSCARLQRTD